MTAVADASVLIALAMADQFELLRKLFGIIHVPQKVFEEVASGASLRPGAAELRQAVEDGWAIIVPMPTGSPYTRGETAVIAHGQELQVSALTVVALLDDPAARRQASRVGLQAVGTGGLLILAKSQGFLPHITPILDRIRLNGFRMHPNLYRQLLTLAGENPAS